MSRLARIVIVGLITASLAVFAGGSVSLGATVRKVALGVGMNDSRNPTVLENFKTSVGRYPAIWTLWSDWGQPGTGVNGKEFPTAMATYLKDRQIVPMIMWEPINPSNQTDCTNWSNQAILNDLNLGVGHQYYDYVRGWAEAAKAHGGRVLLRFMHEMNGPFFIWGKDRCTNTALTIKNLWQKVWTIFHDVGATNVKFLWSVSSAKNATAVYPGNGYVDYMGLSAFNWAKNTTPGRFDRWRSMVNAFSVTMPTLLNLSTKPIIAAEVGSGELPTCSTCSKPNWIKTGYPAVRTKWPRVKAIVYLNIDLTSIGHPNWSLTSPPAALDEYRIIVNDIRFKGGLPCWISSC